MSSDLVDFGNYFAKNINAELKNGYKVENEKERRNVGIYNSMCSDQCSSSFQLESQQAGSLRYI